MREREGEKEKEVEANQMEQIENTVRVQRKEYKKINRA